VREQISKTSLQYFLYVWKKAAFREHYAQEVYAIKREIWYVEK